jgi:hypothetical protein
MVCSILLLIILNFTFVFTPARAEDVSPTAKERVYKNESMPPDEILTKNLNYHLTAMVEIIGKHKHRDGSYSIYFTKDDKVHRWGLVPLDTGVWTFHHGRDVYLVKK